eukprot:scaffold86_cov338-Pavlova_lutheri.AAC.37
MKKKWRWGGVCWSKGIPSLDSSRSGPRSRRWCATSAPSEDERWTRSGGGREEGTDRTRTHLQNFLGFGTPCRVEVEFRGGQDQRTIKVKKKKSDVVEELPLFRTGDTLSGQIKVIPLPGKKVDHAGIKVELIGQIDLQHDRGGSYDFLSLVREVEPAGEMYTTKAMPFEFNAVEMQYESYAGIHVHLRYLLRVTITRNYAVNIVKERHFWVENPSALPEGLTPIKMEVGIEDCLHIEFEYNKGHYHLKDVVVGKIYFMLVRIRLKHMELEIRKRETCGSGTHTHNESETLAKYEIMDGAPVRGESIPIRLFLSPYQLTPTYKNINNKFSVRYFINLVLVDEEDRRPASGFRTPCSPPKLVACGLHEGVGPIGSQRECEHGKVGPPQEFFVVVFWQLLLAAEDRSEGHGAGSVLHRGESRPVAILQPSVSVPAPKQVVYHEGQGGDHHEAVADP